MKIRRKQSIIKLLLLHLVYFLFLSAPSLAIIKKNTRINKQLSFGPKIGLSFSRLHIMYGGYPKVSIEKLSNASVGNIAWAVVGLTSEYPISSKFCVALEVLYERRGYYSLEDLRIQQESIVAPLSIKYYPKKMGNGISLHLGIAPIFAFSEKYYKLTGGVNEAVEENQVTKDEVAQENTNSSQNTSFELEKFDLAAVGGIEYTFGNGMKLGCSISKGILERWKDRINTPRSSNKDTWLSAGNQLYILYNLARLI